MKLGAEFCDDRYGGDYFLTNTPGRERLISDIAKCFYRVFTSENENNSSQ